MEMQAAAGEYIFDVCRFSITGLLLCQKRGSGASTLGWVQCVCCCNSAMRNVASVCECTAAPASCLCALDALPLQRELRPPGLLLRFPGSGTHSLAVHVSC
jgi:hypothetical protein